MNKNAIGLCALALTFSAQAAEPQKINWMATLVEIQAAQPSNPEEVSQSRLTYAGQLKGAPYHQEYLFSDAGKLKNILYYRSYSTANNDCAGEYERMLQA